MDDASITRQATSRFKRIRRSVSIARLRRPIQRAGSSRWRSHSPTEPCLQSRGARSYRLGTSSTPRWVSYARYPIVIASRCSSSGTLATPPSDFVEPYAPSDLTERASTGKWRSSTTRGLLQARFTRSDTWWPYGRTSNTRPRAHELALTFTRRRSYCR